MTPGHEVALPQPTPTPVKERRPPARAYRHQDIGIQTKWNRRIPSITALANFGIPGRARRGTGRAAADDGTPR
ncbi:hypothetical protein EVAR_98984_1 [Eumeta japonica]|uniref:Uncharacterized protein n=1 Tax=Eumeta variegata TaxID=151549 RepID=A0A4C1YM76_EUMVA|nr:hypothetical protein EVAR_98984_1 [Eumeta japonica]